MYHIKDDKRSITSSNMIYAALSDLMHEKNFDDIKITEVVARAQVGRATFYRNFDHLSDVLYYRCDQRFEELYHYLNRYYHKGPPEEYSYFITPFLKFWYLDSIIIEELLKARKFKYVVDAFGKLLKRGIAETDYSDPAFEDNIDYFIAMRSGIAIHTLVQWIHNGKDLTPEEISTIVVKQMGSNISQSLFKKTSKTQ